MHPINLLTAVLLPNPHEVLGQLELSELVTTSGLGAHFLTMA